jgi:S-DNA-T family DNA segregation ATPase FtsK/SpoIIIE
MRKKRRVTRRRRSVRFKLKKNTIYNIFGIGSVFTAAIFFLSYTESGDSMIVIHDLLVSSFGAIAFMFPLLLIFLGLFFFRLKFVLSRPNIVIGFALFFFSLLSLTHNGTIGVEMYRILAEILTVAGANLVYIAGLVISIIVFFDTSVDELVKAVSYVARSIHRLFPKTSFRREKSVDAAFDRNKPMTIKGGANKEFLNALAQKTANGAPMINKKEQELLSEKLVSNALSGADGVWEYPPLSLLNEAPGQKADRGDINQIASVIEKTLQSFGVEARVAEVNLGPAVTQYALEIALGTKVSKITSLANDLALATEAPTGQIRIEAPIPGRNLVGIEIPNRSLEVVTLRTMLSSSVVQKAKPKLTVSLGLDVSGSPVIYDIAKMPHVLVAGTTGSGKSVLINAFISSLLFRSSPSEVKFILVDPKRVEFTAYNGIPHLLTPVIVEPEKILSALKWAMGEMDRRYKLFAERGVRNIDGYNELSGFQALPYIVIIVDELADLMM